VQNPVNFSVVDGDCYRFQINDSYGDGICCSYGSGSYTVKIGSTVISSGGSFSSVDGDKFVVDLNVSVEDLVNENSISIYPNPTKESSTISFNLNESSQVTMEVYNTMGSMVFTNGTEVMSPGNQKLIFNGSELPSGMYFVNLTVGDQVITKKISLLK
jgi:hypothetical protein